MYTQGSSTEVPNQDSWRKQTPLGRYRNMEGRGHRSLLVANMGEGHVQPSKILQNLQRSGNPGESPRGKSILIPTKNNIRGRLKIPNHTMTEELCKVEPY